MEINMIEDKSDSMIFELKGEEHSFPALLCWGLLEDKKVEIAVYDLEHPLIGKPRIHIKTIGKAPRKAINDALELIGKEMDSLKRGIAKAKD